MTALPAISQDQALAFRLERQGLGPRKPGMMEAAALLLGAQAQVHSAAVLQLRARSADTTAEAVRGRLNGDRSLVKLWAQRSTLHVIRREDVAAMLALRRHFVPQYRRWLASGGLSDDQIDRLAMAIVEALDQNPLSRAELTARLTPMLGDWARPWLEHSWGGAIKLAATMGLVCHGPDRPRETCFAALQQWAPTPPFDAERELTALVRRYFRTYGPATPRDLAKFTGLPAQPLRTVLAALKPELATVSLAGHNAWILAEDEAALRTAEFPARAVAVLPHFDPYLLAHASSDPILPAAARPLIYRVAGWISPVVLRQGRVVALWSHRKTGDRWAVEARPIRRVAQRDWQTARRQLAHLAAAYGPTDVELRIGESP